MYIINRDTLQGDPKKPKFVFLIDRVCCFFASEVVQEVVNSISGELTLPKGPKMSFWQSNWPRNV